MTFILELDLDIVMTYLHAKNEVNRSCGSKVIIQTTQTDRWTESSETFTFPLSQAVIMIMIIIATTTTMTIIVMTI